MNSCWMVCVLTQFFPSERSWEVPESGEGVANLRPVTAVCALEAVRDLVRAGPAARASVVRVIVVQPVVAATVPKAQRATLFGTEWAALLFVAPTLWQADVVSHLRHTTSIGVALDDDVTLE